SFEMKGAISKGNRVELHPTKWIVQPEGSWQMVSLKGSLDSDGMGMTLEIYDANQEKVSVCSEVILQLAGGIMFNISCHDHLESERNSPAPSEPSVVQGIWKGGYSCNGQPTTLEIK